MTINDSDLFLYLIAGGFTAVVGIIIAYAYFAIKKSGSSFDEQLIILTEDDNDPNAVPKPSISARWNRYWSEIAKESGIGHYHEADNNAGRDIVFLGIAAAVALSIAFGNVIAGAVVSVGMVFLASTVMKQMSNKKAEQINNQLPGFLFALKANVQASETPEKAILKVIDSMPSPLYDDIVIVKKRLLANSTFKEALQELSYKTASRDLKFLCACMVQASSSGANLEDQISTIQKILDARREVSNELTKAVKSVSPSIWVASIVIPGTFIATYFMDPSSQKFWFIEPFSWVALAGVAILWGAGIWLSMRMVNNIKNI
jgi:Flp pilus assembly protein TadB